MIIDDKDFLEKFYQKIEHIEKEMTDIKITIAKQEQNLAHHIYRTELAENNLDLLRSQIKPIENHVKYVEGILKFIGLITAVGGAVAAIISIF